MVPGIVEFIPLILEIGLMVFKLLGKDKREKEKGDFKSNLERVKSILNAMEPLIELKKKSVAGGILEYLKQLIQTVDKGNQLVDGIEKSDKKKYTHHNQELQDWLNSFQDSLCSAMLRIFVWMATNMEEIKHLLPHRLQKPEFHLHLHCSSCRAHQQLSLEEEDWKIEFRKFAALGGLDRLLQGCQSIQQTAATPRPSAPLPRSVPLRSIAPPPRRAPSRSIAPPPRSVRSRSTAPPPSIAPSHFIAPARLSAPPNDAEGFNRGSIPQSAAPLRPNTFPKDEKENTILFKLTIGKTKDAEGFNQGSIPQSVASLRYSALPKDEKVIRMFGKLTIGTTKDAEGFNRESIKYPIYKSKDAGRV